VLQDALTAVYKWADEWQLSVSIEKCYVLSLGKATNQVVLFIGNSVLPVVQSCRDLGITMTHDLSFSEHINNIHSLYSTPACQCHLSCFVSRNITLLLRAYLVYVRPLLEYKSTIWSPHYKYDTDAVERVQRRFTKRLPGLSNYTYNERLSFLNIPNLEQRRMRADLILCYKMLFGHPNSSVDFFETRPAGITRGHPYKLYKWHSCCSTRSSFFSERIVNAWNNLPELTLTFHRPSPLNVK